MGLRIRVKASLARLGLHQHRGAGKQTLRPAVACPHGSDEPAAVLGWVVARRDAGPVVRVRVRIRVRVRARVRVRVRSYL